MLLCPVSTIRDDLGFDDMADINAAITEALTVSEASIAAVLQMPSFAAGEQTDTFYVAEPFFVKGPAVRTQFRLRYGFLSAVTGFDAVLGSIAAFGTGSVASYLGSAILNLELGVVTDSMTYWQGQFVRIAYTYGFDVDADDDTLYDQTRVPNWLRLAAQVSAKMLLAQHPIMERTQVKIDPKIMQGELGRIVGPKLRFTPNALMPL